MSNLTDRPRRFDSLAESHRSRIAVTPGRRSLDDRTWADLNLDDVFTSIDRTTSSLGQQALYHRLRSAPVGDGLETFEALSERLRNDVGMRQRARRALSRLKDPQGYDVWWLGRPGAIEGRTWYALFPVLTAAAVIAIALVPFSPAPLIVVLLINMTIRYLVDRQIGAIVLSIRQFLLLDATGVYFGLRDLNTHRASLLRVVAAVGDIDAAMSVASWREGTRDWTRPRFQAKGSLALSGLRHPLIDDAVPNSITLRPGSGVLVTGSNMSGKSTFLRTVGVNAILAQTLNTCLARDYTGPVFEVRSCIGRSDDLLSGKSYYLVEVEALLGLVRSSESDRPHMFLLDELFRGTNAVERVAAGEAVLRELLEAAPGARPHLAIVATHDGELVALLPQLYDAYHFGDSIGADGLAFDHQLKPGPATTRTAIALLRQSGAPERLLQRATDTAAILDRRSSEN